MEISDGTSKAIKITAGILAALGLVSVIYLYVSKKPGATPAPKTAVQTGLPIGDTSFNQPQTKTPATTVPVATAPVVSMPGKVLAPAPVSQPVAAAAKVDPKALSATQWQQCKGKTMAAGKELFWSVQISEAIPAGGTYAKGTLNNDSTLPVHVIVKSDSAIAAKIKAMLVVGKTAFLRGTCTDVAADGSVVLQAF